MSKAIFFGSFNPPHQGHYTCIKSLIESDKMDELGIDQIRVIPCWQNPNKPKCVGYEHRWKMCRDLFSDFLQGDNIVIDDSEELVKPKYTYDLLEWIREHDTIIGNDFWWIITTETLQEIIDNKWYRSAELLYDNNFIILYKESEGLDKVNEIIEQNKLCAVPIRLNEEINYHSTELRDKVRRGESISKETNTDIQTYIIRNKLYEKE